VSENGLESKILKTNSLFVINKIPIIKVNDNDNLFFNEKNNIIKRKIDKIILEYNLNKYVSFIHILDNWYRNL